MEKVESKPQASLGYSYRPTRAENDVLHSFGSITSKETFGDIPMIVVLAFLHTPIC